MNERRASLMEDIGQLQFEVLCGLLWHPELAGNVTPHLFAGSPASVCIVKAIKGGARSLVAVAFAAAKIAKVSPDRFPMGQLVDLYATGGSKPGTAMRIRVLKVKARELYELERSNMRAEA